MIMQNNSVLERSYTNDFHRQNSMGAVKEVESMLLHPYSREQEVGTDQLSAPKGSFKREQQLAKIQEKRIRHNWRILEKRIDDKTKKAAREIMLLF